jgi:hypothetical protein
VVAWLIEFSNTVLFSTSDSAWVQTVYYIGLTFIIGSIIWLIIYVSPKLLQTAFGAKNSLTQPPQPPQENPPNKQPPPQTEALVVKNEASSSSIQVQGVSAGKEADSGGELSESEKLRREFRNRGF